MVSQRKKIVSILIIFFVLPLSVYFTLIGIRYTPKADINEIDLSFSQETIALSQATPTALNIVLAAGENRIGFARVHFKFDTTKIRLTSEIASTESLTRIVAQTTMVDANSTGEVVFVIALDPQDIANAPTGTFNLATVSMRALDNVAPATNLSFDTQDIQIVDLNASVLTVNTRDTIVNFIAPTQSQTGNPGTLNFTVKLQGILTQGTNKEASVIIKNATETVIEDNTITLTSDSQGVYSGSVGNIPPGTYEVYIKEKSRLTKKFLGIIIAEGTNILDATTEPLKAGDFNNDNKITILDIAQILSQYTALSIPVSQTNDKYDINDDATINITDIALTLSNYTALEVLGE